MHEGLADQGLPALCRLGIQFLVQLTDLRVCKSGES